MPDRLSSIFSFIMWGVVIVGGGLVVFWIATGNRQVRR